MTQEEILEGNKLIAEFMNFDYKREMLGHGGVLFMTLGIEHTRYNSSLDWLMPVVEKTRNVAFNLWDSNKTEEKIWLKANMWSCEVSWVDEETGEYPICEPIKCDTFLEAVYQAIIEFIKWHNYQTK